MVYKHKYDLILEHASQLRQFRHFDGRFDKKRFVDEYLRLLDVAASEYGPMETLRYEWVDFVQFHTDRNTWENLSKYSMGDMKFVAANDFKLPRSLARHSHGKIRSPQSPHVLPKKRPRRPSTPLLI